MVLYLCVLIVFSLRRESLKLILATNPSPRWFCHNFVHGLGTEFAEYLDITYGDAFVHCMVEEEKLILDRILSVTPLEDLQLKAPHISEEEPIITYLDASEVSTSPGRELLQLTTSEISSNKEEDDHTPFPLSIKEDCFEYDIGNLS
jgi:hypothetical protein